MGGSPAPRAHAPIISLLQYTSKMGRRGWGVRSHTKKLYRVVKMDFNCMLSLLSWSVWISCSGILSYFFVYSERQVQILHFSILSAYKKRLFSFIIFFLLICIFHEAFSTVMLWLMNWILLFLYQFIVFLCNFKGYLF